MKQRTLSQNNSMYVFFKELADSLNDKGMYISRVIKTEAPWNADRVKELIWKPTQETLFNKTSTTKLTTGEVNKVFEVIHKAMIDKELDIKFPSAEELMWEERLR